MGDTPVVGLRAESRWGFCPPCPRWWLYDAAWRLLPKLLHARLDGHAGEFVLGGAGWWFALEAFAGDFERPFGGADGGVVRRFGAADIFGLDAATDEVIEKPLIPFELEERVDDGIAIELFDDVRGMPLFPYLTREVLDSLDCLAGQ